MLHVAVHIYKLLLLTLYNHMRLIILLPTPCFPQITLLVFSFITFALKSPDTNLSLPPIATRSFNALRHSSTLLSSVPYTGWFAETTISHQIPLTKPPVMMFPWSSLLALSFSTILKLFSSQPILLYLPPHPTTWPNSPPRLSPSLTLSSILLSLTRSLQSRPIFHHRHSLWVPRDNLIIPQACSHSLLYSLLSCIISFLLFFSCPTFLFPLLAGPGFGWILTCH